MASKGYEVWCLVCNGGGKRLAVATTERKAWAAGSGHNSTFGHALHVSPAK